ncbi:hypothetical protein [Maribacter sp. ACAM166]|uniref:hypothetical protein n=1 Tax=Maribacter sp. ACAM166 TaxID=2508996 RepID=UPI0010FD9C98|nr:hypothetical protein [Maribacter sp. ACAM166]TLP73219.1 hypothetical protein ES765_17300 [Maribacter sp. ACAM166]
MNKIVFSVLLISFSTYSFAQAYPNSLNNHEIKFNIGQFLVTSAVEGAYEYYLNDDTSIGGTIYFNGDGTDYNGNFGIGPNLRAYFGYAPRSGFFAEVFGLYYTGEDDEVSKSLGSRNYDYSTTAIGLGAGSKWTTRSQRFILEINGGIGRNINPEDFQNDFMFKAGLSIGFRL